MRKADHEGSTSLSDRFWRALSKVRMWEKLRAVLGHVGLRRLLKRTYCRLFGPNGGAVTVELAGHRARFQVHTRSLAEGLRGLLGEDAMLEAMLHTVNAGDCAYDIGAERGLYAFLLASAVGDRGLVVAFEPAREAFEGFQDNMQLNQARNVRSFRVALGDSVGRLKLFSGSTGYAPTLSDSPEIRQKYAVAEEVSVVPGDSLVASENLPIPKAVKIDAEGAELAILRGLSHTLSEPGCQLLCCEIHPEILPSGVTQQTVVDFIKSLGFSRVELRPAQRTTVHAICRKLP